jgi:hypothetical protein
MGVVVGWFPPPPPPGLGVARVTALVRGDGAPTDAIALRGVH